MTRAAFLFSGQLRGFPYCVNSLTENLFSAFDSYDTFFHIPPEDGVALLSCWNPTSVLIEPDQLHPNLEGFGDKIVHSNNIPGYKVYNNALQHYWLQWYSVKRCFELFDSYRSVNNTHYDVVFRIRCDIGMFKQKFIYEPFDGIQIPAYKAHFGIYDRLAFGSVDYIRYYCSIYDKIRAGEYMENVNLGNSESKLLQHLVASGIKIKLIEMKYDRIRKDGTSASTQENPG